MVLLQVARHGRDGAEVAGAPAGLQQEDPVQDLEHLGRGLMDRAHGRLALAHLLDGLHDGERGTARAAGGLLELGGNRLKQLRHADGWKQAELQLSSNESW